MTTCQRSSYKNLLSNVETSSETVRTSNYVRLIGLQNYEPGMQYDVYKCLLQLLSKIYPSIIDDSMFKINKLESTFWNDCDQTTNNDNVCIHLSLHLEDSSNLQIIIGMLCQLMDTRRECLKSYRCVDRYQKLNTLTKIIYVTVI